MTKREYERTVKRLFEKYGYGGLYTEGRRLALEVARRWGEEPRGIEELTLLSAAAIGIAPVKDMSDEAKAQAVTCICRAAFQLGYEQRKRDEIVELAESGGRE